jgi:hypothetical protein
MVDQTWVRPTPRAQKWLLALVLLALAAAAMAASHASGASSPQADRIRTIERARLQLLVDAKTSDARGLMAEDFEVINPGGGVITREDYLAAVAAGDIDYLAFEPTSPIEVRLHGDAAALRFRVHFDLVVFGLHLTHEGWITELYELRGGDWQIVWEQATAVPNNFDLLLEALMPIN